MSLDRPDVIDALGIEKATGAVVLTIVDSWDWENERQHLLALQAKINAYLGCIESGEVWELCPHAKGQQIVIDVIGRCPLPKAASDYLQHAGDVCAQAGLLLRIIHHPDR